MSPCGNTYDVNYCSVCRKIIEPAADHSENNAMKACGISVLTVGLILAVIVTGAVASNGSLAWIYTLSAGICAVFTGIFLLGISAVVDRLNTLIKLMKEKNK